MKEDSSAMDGRNSPRFWQNGEQTPPTLGDHPPNPIANWRKSLSSFWAGVRLERVAEVALPPPRSAPVNGIVLGGWSGSLPCSQCHPGGQRPCPPALQCKGRGGRGCTSSSTEALQRHVRLNFRGDRLRHCPMPCERPPLASLSQRDSAGGRTRETALTPTTKLSFSRKGVLVTRTLVPLPGLFRSSPGAQD